MPAFTKMSGSGNDFVIIDHRDGALAGEDFPLLARRICRRHLGVGADGLILVENSVSADFRWRFYNADGSEAEMCGNGGRCVARYAVEKGIAQPQLTFETRVGLIAAKVNGSRVKLRLQDPTDFKMDYTLKLEHESLTLSSVNTGVPHAVVMVKDLETLNVMRLGREIRFHPHFAPAGTNVNFIFPLDNHLLLVRTYERGVEDETLACGTGACASALIATAQGLVFPPISVQTKGGEVLTIHFNRQDNHYTDLYLEGEVRMVFEGQLNREALLGG